MIKEGSVVTLIENAKIHMTPRYTAHSEVINICPIALTVRGRRKGGGRKWN